MAPSGKYALMSNDSGADMECPFISLSSNVDSDSTKQTRLNEIRELSDAFSSSWLIRNEYGFYIGRSEDVKAILKDGRWHHGVLKFLVVAMGFDPELSRHNVLFLDGEEHRRLKKNVLKAIRHDSQKSCRLISENIISGICDKTEIDIVSDIIFAYPSSVISSLLGIPEKDWPLMDEISGQLIKRFEGSGSEFAKESLDATIKFYMYLTGLFIRLRETPDENNIISEFLEHQKETGLDDFDLITIIGSTYGGGVDTVRCQLGILFDYFLSNPGSYEEVSSRYFEQLSNGVDASQTLATMIREISRLNPTIRGSIRYASEDIEYRNVMFKKGTFLFIGYASANMDKSTRERAEFIDFELAEINHYQDLTFGAGIHKCPGASLAMDEEVLLLERFIHTFSHIERNGEPTYRQSGALIFGPNSLPVKLTRREKPESMHS
jgi:cytochrome P450